MTRILICKNPNSKFKGQLRLNYPIAFVFDLGSENTIFPVHTSLYELLNDGWEIISEKESVTCVDKLNNLQMFQEGNIKTETELRSIK